MKRPINILLAALALLLSATTVTRAQRGDSAAAARYRQGRDLYRQAQRLRTGTESPMDYEKAFELYGRGSYQHYTIALRIGI